MEDMTAKDIWDRLWEKKIRGQKTYRDLLWYFLLGAIVDERERDLRIHILFVCDSSSGKTEGLYFLKYFLDKLQVSNEVVTEVTDATLLGQYDLDAEKHNHRHGLSLENPEIENNKGIQRYKNPIKIGWFGTRRALLFSEAEQILDPKQHNERIQTFFRQAMDKQREITKGVSSQLIKYKTDTSFVLVSFPMKDEIKNITESGFLQRCFFLYKEIDRSQHKDINQYLIRHKYNNEVSDTEDLQYTLLCNELIKICEFYRSNKPVLSREISEYANVKFEELEENFEMIYKNKHLLSFIRSNIRRSHDKILALLTLQSISHFSTSIEKEDFDKAFKIYLNCLESSIEMMIGDKDFTLNLVTKNILKHNKELNKTRVVEKIHSSLKETSSPMGMNKIWDYFKELEALGKIRYNGDIPMWNNSETTI